MVFLPRSRPRSLLPVRARVGNVKNNGPALIEPTPA
jgi:hypothetical protein